MTALLEVRGLSAGYGRVTVLRDVDLVLRRGSVATLLGPNGAGKTTLLRAVAGLLTPTRGSVLIDGVDVTGCRAHQRARRGLCLIPEGRGVFPNLTVRENLLLQVPPWEREDKLDRAYETFPALGESTRKRAGSLSGGQQQQLALARCFLARPAIAMLDEVSMGLAPRVVDEIFAALLKLASDGVAVLLVEQYITRAIAVADTVHLINRGRLTFSGPPSEVNQENVLRRYLGADMQPHS
jgi:branched-chain amino acid transport system ATP-binding protein